MNKKVLIRTVGFRWGFPRYTITIDSPARARNPTVPEPR